MALVDKVTKQRAERGEGELVVANARDVKDYGDRAYLAYKLINYAKTGAVNIFKLLAIILSTHAHTAHVLTNMAVTATAASTYIMTPLQVPIALWTYVIIPWRSYVRTTIKSMQFWLSLEYQMSCLLEVMDASVWEEKLQFTTELTTTCSPQTAAATASDAGPDGYTASLREAILDAHKALLSNFRTILEMARCFGVGGLDFNNEQSFDKRHCLELSRDALLDPDHGLLAQLAFRAQVFAAFVDAVAVDSHELGLIFMRNFFAK
jgi:hypothetical protein